MAKEIVGIDINLLKEVKRVFKETDIEEMELEKTDSFYLKASRKKPAPTVVQTVAAPVAQVAPVAAAPVAIEAPAATPAAPAGDPYADEAKYQKISSPVIGTFYAAPSPEAPNFIKVGDMVNPDTTVCIVEAMKVMNEIKADCKGKVVQILKSNAEAVQSGEPMVVVEKN